MKITQILYVDKIETSIPFWVDRLGFEKTIEVPEGDALGFIIIQKGTAELMFQTYAGVEKDMPQIADLARPGAGTFIEVDDFDDLLKHMEGADIVMPERKTFYEMREILVREPGGNIICFAGRIQQ